MDCETPPTVNLSHSTLLLFFSFLCLSLRSSMSCLSHFQVAPSTSRTNRVLFASVRKLCKNAHIDKTTHLSPKATMREVAILARRLLPFWTDRFLEGSGRHMTTLIRLGHCGCAANHFPYFTRNTLSEPAATVQTMVRRRDFRAPKAVHPV